MRAGDGCCDIGGSMLETGLDAAAVELATRGFVALWHGRNPIAEELLPGRPELVGGVLNKLVQLGRAEVDAGGALVGVHGLTLHTNRHHFEHAGLRHHTWCAFDAVGIPAALSLDALSTTDCPTCRRRLTVRVSSGAAIDGDGIALWLPAPDRSSHLRNDFCANADLYCSREHLHERVDTESTPGRVATVEEALVAGCATWADVADAIEAERRANARDL